ncbi:MAG TPA: hypothetical protein VM452_01645 [Caulifigura sp.]|nr:hypothetical protein [Caulifigura sp.]
MIRKTLLSAMVLCASVASSARAQDFTPPALPDLTAARPISAEAAAPVRPASNTQPPVAVTAQGATTVAPVAIGGPGCTYPKLNAPLYPSPSQFNPSYTGGSIITNQAFAPHEMLYPHKYHAMYGPFYYRVRGHWVMTPFGMRQNEQWELQGTEVKVNYRSTYAPFSGFHPKCF